MFADGAEQTRQRTGGGLKRPALKRPAASFLAVDDRRVVERRVGQATLPWRRSL
jgi:hypothetical protein